jgi:hypothetical protein
MYCLQLAAEKRRVGAMPMRALGNADTFSQRVLIAWCCFADAGC